MYNVAFAVYTRNMNAIEIETTTVLRTSRRTARDIAAFLAIFADAHALNATVTSTGLINVTVVITISGDSRAVAAATDTITTI